MTKEIINSPMFLFRCQQYRHGKLVADYFGHNQVMTVGKNLLNDTLFRQGTGSSIFIGMKGTGTTGAGDTMASHSGWIEGTNYSGNRITLTAGAAVGGTSTFTPGTFAMTGTYTAAGAFITTVNTVGGTTGTLYSAGDFASVVSGGTGDTLVITPTLVTA